MIQQNYTQIQILFSGNPATIFSLVSFPQNRTNRRAFLYATSLLSATRKCELKTNAMHDAPTPNNGCRRSSASFRWRRRTTNDKRRPKVRLLDDAAQRRPTTTTGSAAFRCRLLVAGCQFAHSLRSAVPSTNLTWHSLAHKLGTNTAQSASHHMYVLRLCVSSSVLVRAGY